MLLCECCVACAARFASEVNDKVPGNPSPNQQLVLRPYRQSFYAVLGRIKRFSEMRSVLFPSRIKGLVSRHVAAVSNDGLPFRCIVLGNFLGLPMALN